MSKCNKFVKGALILSIAGIITKCISFLFRIPLTYLLEETGIGYYQNVYSVYIVLVAVLSIGFPQIISKYVATKVADNDEADANKYFRHILKIAIAVGIVISVFMAVFAGALVELLGWAENIEVIIYIFAIAPTFVAVSGCIRGYFQGHQDMGPTALAQVVEGLGKFIFGVGLAYILCKCGYPIIIAARGAAIGCVIGVILSALVLIIKYYRINGRIKLNDGIESKISLKAEILQFAIPATIGASAYSIMNVIDSVIFYNRLDSINVGKEAARVMFGQITKCNSIINVPLALAVAITLAVVPSIAKAYKREDKGELNRSVNLSLKLSMVLGLPSGIGLIVLAQPIVKLIYQSQSGGYVYLALLGICLPFIIIAQTLIAMLHGVGQFAKAALCLIPALITKVLLNYFLIATELKGRGAVLGSIAFCIILAVTSYMLVQKELRPSIDYVAVFIKPFLVSAVMGTAAYIMYRLLENRISNAILTMGCVAFSGIIYIAMLVGFKIFRKEELLDIKVNK